jgi:hypothetical protein
VFLAAAFANGFLYFNTLNHGAFAPAPHPIPISYFPVGIVLLLAGALSRSGKFAKYFGVGALACFSLSLSIVYVLMPMYVFGREIFILVRDAHLLVEPATRAQNLLSFVLALLGPVFALVAVSQDVDDKF